MSATTIDIDSLTLTKDQEAAEEAFNEFILNPMERVFVLRGYSGCGKSTLVRRLIDRLPAIQRMLKLVVPNARPYDIKLTATTNKAAENLSDITGMDVVTIQSALGLRVETDYRTNMTRLVPRLNFQLLEHTILFIDESSYVDPELLDYVFKRTRNCKIVFVGDPAQLRPVKCRNTPVFDADFPSAELREVVRQPKKQGVPGEVEPMHPITAWAEQLRNTVITGVWTPFTPDGFHIRRLSRDEFNAAIEQEFTRPDWKYKDSKVLAWTNKCVIAYNQFIRNLAKGDPHFQVGDYAVVNKFVQVGKYGLKTDQMVQITGIEPDTLHHGVLGNFMTVDHSYRGFQPQSLADKNTAIREARKNNQLDLVQEMEDQWFDLRGAPAQTINKAQGSTYGSVYIDLDDVSRCHDTDQLARMLYVGASRARNHVFLTGDLA